MELYTYTGSRISTDVKDKFGDAGNVQITDAMVLRWINNGIRQIVASAPFLKLSASFNQLANTASYAISTVLPAARIMAIHSVVANGKPLKIVPFSEYEGLVLGSDIDATTGAAEYATYYGDTLTLWPVPTTTVAAGIVIYYDGYPADLALISDDLTVPDRFYNALQDYVFAQALELDENFEAAQIKLGHHEVNLQRQFELENRGPVDFYPTVTMDPYDDDARYFG